MEQMDKRLRGEEDDQFEMDAKDWDAKLTPLHYSVFYGNDKFVQLLIDEKGMRNQYNPYIDIYLLRVIGIIFQVVSLRYSFYVL